MRLKLSITLVFISVFFVACGSDDDECAISNCHGLTVECDYTAPLICTESYEIGDRCRTLASCDDSSGSCEVVNSPAFEACKLCVEACIASNQQSDGIQLFSCEESCGIEQS